MIHEPSLKEVEQLEVESEGIDLPEELRDPLAVFDSIVPSVKKLDQAFGAIGGDKRRKENCQCVPEENWQCEYCAIFDALVAARKLEKRNRRQSGLLRACRLALRTYPTSKQWIHALYRRLADHEATQARPTKARPHR